jgi:hypothetical protein
MRESPESKQMRNALTAIKAKLERMRLERTYSMERLAATRQAADDARTDRRSQPLP